MVTPEPQMMWRKSSYSTNNGDCVEVGWRKSSYSTDNGDCVEIGWRKSSYSATDNGCVEVAVGDPQVRVRDTKDRASGALTFAAPGWRAFLTALTGGH